MKVLFVVHRTFPFNGGSEYNVKVISVGLSEMGCDVTVLTDNSGGNYGNVKVVTEREFLFLDYDWVIVHGADMPLQDFALNNISSIPSKTFYWMIYPSFSKSAMNGFYRATKIGWGTTQDLKHLLTLGEQVFRKMKYIRYAIDPRDFETDVDFRRKYDITTERIILCPDKNAKEVVEYFNGSRVNDVTLVITSQTPPILKSSQKVRYVYLEDRKDYIAALKSSNLLVHNSKFEGFGIMLLDAMLSKVPWVARNIAGAADMKEYGKVFEGNSIGWILEAFRTKNINNKTIAAYEYVSNNRLTKNIVDDFIEFL